MRRFLRNILIYGLALGAIWLVVIHPLIAMYENLAHTTKTLSPYSNFNWAYEAKDINADLVVIGNSRAGAYMGPVLSQELGLTCTGLALAGFPFDYQYHVMFETYMSQNRQPKYIVQDVGPWAFFDYFIDNYTIEMLPYLDRPGFQFLREICPEMSRWTKLKAVRYAGRGFDVLREITKLREKPITADRLTHYRKITLEARPLEKNPQIISLFDRYLKECDSLGIQVVLVFSPIHMSDGASLFDVDGFQQLMNQICADNNLLFLDYHDLFGSDENYYYDPMHLNQHGREEFTRTLSHDLCSILHIERTGSED